MSTEEIQYLLDDIDDNGECLTTWEANFIDDMMKRIDSGKPLTDKQIKTIQQIHDDRC